MSDARRLVDKLWSYCNVLRDDGVGTIEYTEQLTYLLFLKMAHEREVRALNPERIVPATCSWQRLLDADGDDLEVTYRHILEDLSKEPGTLGVIFRKAQNRIQDPAKLKRLIVDLIDKENWSATGTDIKGDAYEELLSKGAEDIQVRGRAVLHSAPVDPGDGRLCSADGWGHRGRSRRWYGRIPAGRGRLKQDVPYGYTSPPRRGVADRTGKPYADPDQGQEIKRPDHGAWLVLVAGYAVLATVWTGHDPGWYARLARPSFQPPDLVFAGRPDRGRTRAAHRPHIRIEPIRAM